MYSLLQRTYHFIIITTKVYAKQQEVPDLLSLDCKIYFHFKANVVISQKTNYMQITGCCVWAIEHATG